MISRIGTSARMSKIVKHNGTAYICGQVAEDTSLGIKEQTLSTLNRLDQLLSEAGSSREHLLSATVYIKDMKDFAEMNSVWDSWIPSGHAPARACVEAAMARPEILVEVSAIAAIKE